MDQNARSIYLPLTHTHVEARNAHTHSRGALDHKPTRGDQHNVRYKQQRQQRGRDWSFQRNTLHATRSAAVDGAANDDNGGSGDGGDGALRSERFVTRAVNGRTTAPNWYTSEGIEHAQRRKEGTNTATLNERAEGTRNAAAAETDGRENENERARDLGYARSMGGVVRRSSSNSRGTLREERREERRGTSTEGARTNTAVR